MESLNWTFFIINIVFVYGQLTTDQTRTLQNICPGFDTCYQDAVPESCCLPCSCDINDCSEKRNCCPHLNTSLSHSESDVQANTSGKSCVRTTLNLDGHQKKLSHHESSYSFARLGVYMVNTCPEHINETRCTTPDISILNQSIPITSEVNAIFYRNVFCALCNDENYNELVPWKAFVTCSVSDITKADDMLFPASVDKIYQNAIKTDKGVCGVEFIPSVIVIDRKDYCFDNVSIISNCPENFTNEAIITACKSLHMPYIALKENRTHVYGNYFCYLCNKEDIGDEDQCSNELQLHLHTDTRLVAELNNENKNDSLIMSPWLQDDLTPSRYIPSGVKCRDRTVYDPYKDSCRNWYCPAGRQFANIDDCVPIYVDATKASYTMAMNLVPRADTKLEYHTANLTKLSYDILNSFFAPIPNIDVEIVVLAVKESFSYMYVFVKITIDSSTSNKSRIYDKAMYGRNISVNFDTKEMVFTVDLSVGTKIELNVFSINDAVVIDRIDYSALATVFKVQKDVIREAFKETTINKLAFCTQILLTHDEVFDYVEIVDVIVSDMPLNVGEFSRTAKYGEVHICLSDYLRKIDAYLHEKNKQLEFTPQAIVSVICNMLSMAGLIITIFTYIVFDELRSIPGKNNMMLALHLLIAQSLYQFGMDKSENPKVCVVLGVCIHWFWLTAIFWMNACTLHMFRTFVTGQSYRSVRALDPQVCCYALYCYGVATAMVAINMGVSVYKSNGSDLGYGGSVCYISEPMMVGWVFALPVGVIIIINMGFFFAVVYQISASTMRRRGKSTDRANTIIYMKLSSLTGVTWIFGYLYIWTDFAPLDYIFIVLNAGQGVFIFISFICTKRIMKLYWNLVRKGCRSIRSRSCYCFCFKKIGDNTDTTNGVEMNTAKVSLTAGSTSTKGISSSRKGTNKDVAYKVSTIAKANDVYSGGKSIDKASESLKGNDIVTDRSNSCSENDGNVKAAAVNDVPTLTIAPMGIQDVEFIPASTK